MSKAPTRNNDPKLQGLAISINQIVEETVSSVAQAKISIGKLLLEAREEFSSDLTFGKWRQENTLITSKQEANYCMAVAKKFADHKALIEHTSFAVMKELVSAPQELVDSVMEKAAKGEAPSVREVREEKKKAATSAPPEGPKNKEPEHPPIRNVVPPPKTRYATTMEQMKQDALIVSQPLWVRAKELCENGYEHRPDLERAFMLLGLDPQPQCLPSREVVNILVQEYETRLNGEDHEFLMSSFQLIIDEYPTFAE